jgi:transposase
MAGSTSISTVHKLAGPHGGASRGDQDHQCGDDFAFKDLQARHPTQAAITVILDNARYNHSAEIKVYLACDDCRVRLVYLPAYAPNLNLIERFWWLLKKTTVYNQHYPTFAGFKAAIDGFFASLTEYSAEIRSLIADSFHYIGKQNPQTP